MTQPEKKKKSELWLSIRPFTIGMWGTFVILALLGFENIKSFLATLVVYLFIVLITKVLIENL